MSTRQDGLESLAVTSLRARKNYKVSLAPQAPGFSLIEVLLSMFILTVALLGIAGALALQSGGVAGGITFGLAAINRSHLITTATALAQAMAESVKQATYTDKADNLVARRFPDEDYGAIPGFPAFRRSVMIEPGPDTGTKRITVTVSFRPTTTTGMGQEEQVQLGLILARRPSP